MRGRCLCRCRGRCQKVRTPKASSQDPGIQDSIFAYVMLRKGCPRKWSRSMLLVLRRARPLCRTDGSAQRPGAEQHVLHRSRVQNRLAWTAPASRTSNSALHLLAEPPLQNASGQTRLVSSPLLSRTPCSRQPPPPEPRVLHRTLVQNCPFCNVPHCRTPVLHRTSLQNRWLCAAEYTASDLIGECG